MTSPGPSAGLASDPAPTAAATVANALGVPGAFAWGSLAVALTLLATEPDVEHFLTPPKPHHRDPGKN